LEAGGGEARRWARRRSPGRRSRGSWGRQGRKGQHARSTSNTILRDTNRRVNDSPGYLGHEPWSWWRCTGGQEAAGRREPTWWAAVGREGSTHRSEGEVAGEEREAAGGERLLPRRGVVRGPQQSLAVWGGNEGRSGASGILSRGRRLRPRTNAALLSSPPPRVPRVELPPSGLQLMTPAEPKYWPHGRRPPRRQQ
jgi:hypothetical protein